MKFGLKTFSTRSSPSLKTFIRITDSLHIRYHWGSEDRVRITVSQNWCLWKLICSIWRQQLRGRDAWWFLAAFNLKFFLLFYLDLHAQVTFICPGGNPRLLDFRGCKVLFCHTQFFRPNAAPDMNLSNLEHHSTTGLRAVIRSHTPDLPVLLHTVLGHRASSACFCIQGDRTFSAAP